MYTVYCATEMEWSIKLLQGAKALGTALLTLTCWKDLGQGLDPGEAPWSSQRRLSQCPPRYDIGATQGSNLYIPQAGNERSIKEAYRADYSDELDHDWLIPAPDMVKRLDMLADLNRRTRHHSLG